MTSTRKRIRSRAWFLTWNNPSESCMAQLSEIFGHVEYVIQKEQGAEGTVHLQGVIRYSNPRDRVDERLFDLCHWERCRNWRSAVKYCTKVDTRIDGPWSNVSGLTWRKTIVSPLKGKILYDWQKEVLEICESDPDERTVYWYWDSKGCSGKTSLAKHLCLKYGAGMIYLNGCSKDVLFGVARRLEEVDLKLAIFGLSRQDANGVSYKSLEILKDGIGFSGKYESGMFLSAAMHVFVFANFPPDEEMLSRDRWKINEIVDG